MNYLSYIKKIIRKSQHEYSIRRMWQKLGYYYEKHHIIPECELKKRGKPKKIWDGKWNHVFLTAREHFVMHRLLQKACKQIYGENHRFTKSMTIAVDNFRKRKASKRADYKITSRTYEVLKKENSEVMSKMMSGENHPMWKKERPLEHCKNISIGKTGNIPWNKGKKCPYPFLWIIYRTGGRYDVVDDRLKWCEINGYIPSGLSDVYSRRRTHHKDIIKVEKIKRI